MTKLGRFLFCLGVLLSSFWVASRWRQKSEAENSIASTRTTGREVGDCLHCQNNLPNSGSGSSGKAGAPTAFAFGPNDLRRYRQDVRWQEPIPEASFSAFREWTQRLATAATEAEREELLREGLELTDARRRDLLDLIDKNPERALQLAVPQVVRQTLPPDIVDRLEEMISSRGDLLVVAAAAMPGRERWVQPVQRFVTLSDGREFAAFTFGRRAAYPTRTGLVIHGIALDGKLALSDMPGRPLEPVEAEKARKDEAAPPVCPTSGLLTDANGDEVILDWDGTIHTFYCGPKHAEDMLLMAAEQEAAGLPPIAAVGVSTGTSTSEVTAKSSFTEGTKKLLIIRVDFPDKPGQVVSDSTLTSLINSMSSHWNEMSYGKMTWATAGNGSAFTPTVRLPNGHASYTGFGTMLTAARAAAEDAGYDYRDYQFDVVVTGDKPDVGFGGIAYVGARGAWLANGQWNLGVCSHEVGHNFGLNHAGFWDTTDGTTIGAGDAVEYGNPFDHMGGASSSTNAHFGARQKNYMDWLPDADVKKISANGSTTVRLAAFDKTAATGFRALAIDRSSTTNDYWLEHRQTYAGSNKWIKDGVVLNWGPYAISNAKPLLLDFTPSTSSKDDCPILIGQTFADTAQGIFITPVLRGADANGVSFVDVTVNKGSFSGNLKPSVTLNASNANPAAGASVSFSATATDPNGDVLAYYWNWGDGSFTANNSTAATHTFAAAGTYTVRCVVSDMKGQTATGQLLVQVGSSSTFFVQGVVRNSSNEPLADVVVRADASHSDTTDSEGYYAITGLSGGSYALTASKTGLSFQTSGFSNPVSLGPSKQNLNFVAPPGSPSFGSMKPAVVDAGSNTGDVPLPLTDPDTLVTALTLSGVSSNVAVIPNANITFGTVSTVRTCTVTAPANASGVVDITITATDPDGGTGTYVWPVTVNGKPVLTPTTQTTTENVPTEIDLRSLVTDDFTAKDLLRFDASQVLNGTVTLLPDGHTARFLSAQNFNGNSSFLLSVRDRSLSSRTQFLWDFEPPDATTDGKVSDLSNYNRQGSFEVAGSGGEYAYSPDVAALLGPHSVQSLNLSSSNSGAARVKKSMATTDLNMNDADWSFSAWVKRSGTETDDIIFHLGEGAGFASKEELLLYFAANSDNLKVGKYGTAGLQKEIAATDVAAGQWQHVCLTYDRTGTNTGTLALYVNGFLMGSVTGVTMGLNQSFPLYLGGAQDNTASFDRWFDGRFDDVMLADAVLGRSEIRALAGMCAAHQLGLASSATVTVTVGGINQPPTVTSLPDIGMSVSTASPVQRVVLADAESELRSLALTGASSNGTVLTNSGIGIGPAPASWATGNLGTPGAAGSSIETHGTMVISGAGSGIGGTADICRWTRQNATGDSEIIARVLSLGFTNEAAKAGVMMRDSSTMEAPYAFACITPGQGVSFEYRSAASAAAATVSTVNSVSTPCWLRLVRTGNDVTAFYAPDTGAPPLWVALGTQAVTFPSSPYPIGLAVSSKVNATVATAVIDRLSGTFLMGGERNVTLTPIAGRSGIATVTLTASDGAYSSSSSFNAVIGVNTPPQVTELVDMNAVDGEILSPTTFTVGDLHTAAGSLVVSATSSNGVLLPANRITVSGTGASRSIAVWPVPSETGGATITVSVSDGQEVTTRTFSLTIAPGDPASFIRAGAHWKYLDTGANPVGWQTAAFSDAAWPFGPAQLGFGESDENTLVNATSSRITTYFRKSFNVPSRFDYRQLRLRLIRDDGVVIYLNGTEIARSNMPATAILPTSQAVQAVGGASENVWIPLTVNEPPLVDGTNVLAVELHQSGSASSDLSFDLEVIGGNPEPVIPVPAGSIWQFSDDGTEPAANWKDLAFNVPTTWKAGPAQLGYGDNDEATIIEGGPSTSRFLASYFRRTFSVSDPSAIAQAFIRYVRDDGIIIYLNGQEILRDNMPTGAVTVTTRAAASVGNADESLWRIAQFDPALLMPGNNMLAAEVHQATPTSTDVSFDLETLLYAEDAVPQLNCACTPTTVLVGWPKWASSWTLQQSTDLVNWTVVSAAPVVSGGEAMVTLPRQAGKRYYRLVAP